MRGITSLSCFALSHQQKILEPSLRGKNLSSLFNSVFSQQNVRGMDKFFAADASGQDRETCNVDEEYPGTAVSRMLAIRDRVAELSRNESLDGPWDDVRRKILWAGGLRDLPNEQPGKGYTGHSFNDYNHVDLTAMNDEDTGNRNDGSVKKIAIGNHLGPGIKIASIQDLGPGGSWSTCQVGCNSEPPRDVAHIQFRARIAFKLVWAPTINYNTFVLVDDDGKCLAQGTPSDGPQGLPSLRERMMNYKIVEGSKYATAADEIAAESKYCKKI